MAAMSSRSDRMGRERLPSRSTGGQVHRPREPGEATPRSTPGRTAAPWPPPAWPVSRSSTSGRPPGPGAGAGGRRPRRRPPPGPRRPSTPRRRPPAARSWAGPAPTPGHRGRTRRGGGPRAATDERASRSAQDSVPVGAVVDRRGIAGAASRGRRAPTRTARPGHRGLDEVRSRVPVAVEPAGDDGADRRVQGDQVGGVGEPLHVGVGDPGPQVGEEAVVEHRVAAAPQQEGRAWVGRRAPRRTPASAADEGSPAVTGMSATKSRTAAAAVRAPVGGAQGVAVGTGRSSGPSRPRRPGSGDSSGRPGPRAAAISGGTATSSGLATAVLARTRASTSSDAGGAHRHRAAPVVGGQHQTDRSTSWRQKDTSSATRSASRRGRPRSDQPMPVWSTAITRQAGLSVVSRSRQM